MAKRELQSLKSYEIIANFGPYYKGQKAEFNEDDAKKYAKFIKEVIASSNKKGAADNTK